MTSLSLVVLLSSTGIDQCQVSRYCDAIVLTLACCQVNDDITFHVKCIQQQLMVTVLTYTMNGAHLEMWGAGSANAA